jgi:hypothetical protein
MDTGADLIPRDDASMRRRTWGRHAGWLLLGVAMVAVSAWVVAHALVADTPEDFQRWTNWANVFALPIGMVSAAWLAFDRARHATLPTTPMDQQVDQLIKDLARRLERDWAEEAVFREVTRPRPIRAIAELQARRESSDRLADLLETHGRDKQAIALLGPRADAGDEYAARRLAKVLARTGQVDEGVAILRQQTGDGTYTGQRLTDHLVRSGDVDAAIEFFRGYTDGGASDAVRPLVRLLTDQGRPDEAQAILRARAAAGEDHAVEDLAWWLAGRRGEGQLM